MVLVINPLNTGGFPGEKVNAQSSVRPYVVFVNGYQDCCTWGRNNGTPGSLMNIVSGALPPNSEIRYVPWDRFENGANQRSSTSNDAEFLRQATEFINQLNPNRPLILIGHSFGGDSLLSLAPRISRRIQFLGVIDPTAAGGLREPVTRRGVPSSVDYFFNRWQQNALASANVVPFDSRVVNGSISGCRAGSCDQSEQSLARRQDGSEIRVSCEAHEVSCEGWRLPGCNLSGCWRGSNGTKAKRLAHNDMPLDEYLQRQMADRISNVLANFRPPTPITGVPISVNFGNTLFYDRNAGVCTFAASNSSVIQRLTTCRRTWHSIVYTADKLLFYDRDAGQIETYRVDNRGLGAQLHSYAPGSMRRTWAQITSPQQGIIVFRDDNGQVETYRLNDIGMLQGL